MDRGIEVVEVSFRVKVQVIRTAQKDTPPILRIVDRPPDGKLESQTLDDLAREGARRMSVEALQPEVTEYVDRHDEARDEDGQALVVLNGRAQPRKVTLGSGTIEVATPSSPTTVELVSGSPAASCHPTCAAPRRWLRCYQCRTYRGSRPATFGRPCRHYWADDAWGLSATSIARLVGQWQGKYTAFRPPLPITVRYGIEEEPEGVEEAENVSL